MAAALVSASLASTPLPASSDATRKSNRFAYGLQFSKKNELRLSHGHGRRWSSVTFVAKSSEDESSSSSTTNTLVDQSKTDSSQTTATTTEEVNAVTFVAKSSEDESSSTANTLVDQSKTDSAQTATTTTEEVNASEKPEASADQSKEDKTQQQETDWKVDEDFKNFMGNPSIEAAVKLEKQRAERRLKELDNEASGNIFKNFFTSIVKSTVAKEKERLEKAVETFKALDLNQLKSCFGYDTFFAVDCRRFGDGGIFIGNLRRPIEEVIPKLEKKLADAAGREVVLWFMEEQVNDMKKQVCMVQPKSEIYLQFEATKLSTRWGYISAILLGVATFGTIALVSGFFLKPDATFDDYVANVLPLFGGFVTILGASEVLAYGVGHHSTFVDSNKYRIEEIEHWRRNHDLVSRFRKWLDGNNWWTNEVETSLRDEIRKKLLHAIQVVEHMEKPSIENLFTDVYDRVPLNLWEQEKQLCKIIS